MHKNIINNNKRFDYCPCCRFKNISKIGNIDYGANIKYARLGISLTSQPEIWRCNSCKSWFSQNIISEEDSYRLYSSNQSWTSKKIEFSKCKTTIKVLSSIVYPNCKVLDVGCANGAWLDFAKVKGARTFGLEYSQKHITELKRKKHISYSSWLEVDQCFNVITALDLVEHLYDLDAFIKYCSEKLLRGGMLVVLTGDISSICANKGKNSWWYIRYPEHIVFPSIQFISQIPGFKLMSVTPVYPFNLSVISSIKQIIISVIKPRPNSYCPLVLRKPDHMLVILQKIESKGQ